ncbi:MAG: hypothetical protein V4542_06605 [Pseudomonadota bacterium]
MPVIRAVHLNGIAGQTEGRDRLGEILRRLVWNWLPSRIAGMSFHAGETNNLPSWDGWIRLDMRDGLGHNSVWEISVQDKAPKKIREDFRESQSKELPYGWTHPTTTYVAVTARTLANKGALEAALRRDPNNIWGDVQVIDAEGLEQWIEQCPAVEQWIAEELNISSGRFGVSLSRSWIRWSGVIQPAISPSMLTAGRKLDAVRERLLTPTSQPMTVEADSPDEAVGVIYATLTEFPPETKERLLFNSMVVSESDLAANYSEEPQRDEGVRLTILVPPATIHAAALTRAGHNVVIATGRRNTSSNAISIPRPLRADFEKALIESMSIPAAQASIDARACGSSISIWRVWKLIESIPLGDQVPIWATPPADSRAIPAILARGWEDHLDGDTEVVSLLAKIPYPDFRDSIHSFSICNDPLYETSGSAYKVIAPSVAYALVRDSLNISHIESLRAVVLQVFGEVAPHVLSVWDTSDDEMQLQEAAKYSSFLRDGLAETLLAIAFLPQPHSGVFAKFGGGAAFANALIRQLPGLNSDARLLASLSGQLPLLAEAAPVPFLEALESLLQGDNNLENLFRDRGIFGTSYHASVFWALEVLSWSAEYLHRTTRIMLELDERFSNERSGNSAVGSLKDIYLAWQHGTAVPLAERVDILEAESLNFAIPVWKLLLKLIPQHSDTSTGTHVPTWHDFGRSELMPLTHGDVARAYRAYTELALRLSENSVSRQLDLLSHYSEFPSEYRDTLLAQLKLSTAVAAELTVDEWKRLRKFVARNRSFPTAFWSIKGSELDSLDNICNRLEPPKASIGKRWLFDDPWPEVPVDAGDYETRNALVDSMRTTAIAEVLNNEGIAAVNHLIKDVQYPHIVGAALAKALESDDQLLSHMTEWALDDNRNEFAALRAASAIRFSNSGTEWTASILQRISRDSWGITAKTNAFLDYPANLSTFEIIESLGNAVEKGYWMECWLNPHQMDKKAKSYAARQLIKYGRGTYLLQTMGNQFSEFGADLVLSAAEAAVREQLSATGAQVGQMDSYYFGEALKWLRKQSGVKKMAIAALEYPLVQVLLPPGNDDEQIVLHELMASDPAFFVQILSDVYRGKNQPDSDDIDEKRRVRAKVGWRLLSSFKTVPGTSENGAIVEKILVHWIEAVRQLAVENERDEIAEEKIGQLLYHAKPDPQTTVWPQTAILHVFEKSKSSHLESGFMIANINSRGVTSRAPLDGGSLERILEAEWNTKAKKLSTGFPRTKAMFLRMAAEWKHQAKWHDESAAKLRMKWS